jgi:hypothetical protein
LHTIVAAVIYVAVGVFDSAVHKGQVISIQGG